MKIFYLLLIHFVIGTRKVEHLNSQIEFFREIRGQGLKQEIYTKIVKKDSEKCVLQEKISENWFVDIEEVPKDPKFGFSSIIDIELPASLSKSHTFSIDISKSQEFVYPIHIRYNDCSETKYRTISLDSPVIKCGKNIYEIKDKMEATVAVGNPQDLPFVLITTITSVVVGLFLIFNSIKNFK